MQNLHSKIDFYLDPYINPINKNIISKIEQVTSRDGFRLIRDLSQLNQNELPKIIIFEEDNNSRLKELIDAEENMAIQIDQPNLDMFSSQGILENTFLIENESDFLSAYDLALFHIKNRILLKKEKLKLESNEFLKTIVNSKKSLSLDLLSPNEVNELTLFERKLFEGIELSEIKSELEKLGEKVNLNGLEVITMTELLYKNIQKNFLYISKGVSEPLCLTWQGDELNPQMIISYSLLENYISISSRLLESRERLGFHEDILSRFEFPYAIFDQNEEILVHNSYFVDLNLSSKACLKLEDNEQITINKVIYRVVINKNSKNLIEYLFIPANDYLVSNDNPTFEEMGIISSSIAHELNNPLAGVSAAIDYLLLDDLDSSTQETIQEMKNGVNKCRKLVKTFLSFSQVGNSNDDNLESLKDCFDQALELMRSRLIENNLNFQLNFEKLNALKTNKNRDIFTMLFYLMLSDFVTNLLHHKLVSRQGHKLITLKVFEDTHSITIGFDESSMFESNFFDSKLVNHLLELAHLKIISEDHTLQMKLLKPRDA